MPECFFIASFHWNSSGRTPNITPDFPDVNALTEGIIASLPLRQMNNSDKISWALYLSYLRSYIHRCSKLGSCSDS